MAMPSSGSLGIMTCPGGVACSSISIAVGIGSGSLAANANAVNKAKCMTAFYGLNIKPITLSVISSNCGAGTTADAVLCIKSNPAIGAGECFCMCLCGCLHSGGGVSSSACWVVYCSGVKCYCCTIGTNTTATPSYAIPVMMTTSTIGIYCVCLHGVVTAGFAHTCSCANISCVCSCIGTFVNVSPSGYNLCTC